MAAGCPEAAEAATAVFRSGGNVMDAAIAGSAVLCVAMPQAVSIGGDLFALVKMGGVSSPLAMNASGGAPRMADVDAFRRRGYSRIPSAGPLSIQAPGLVAGWQALADRFASRPLGDLLKPAIACAADGVIVTPRLERFVAEAAPEYSAYAGYDETYKIGDGYLSAESIWRQPRLARALEAIAREGARGFYDGWVAADIARSVTDAGGFLAVEDLAAVSAEIAPALSTRFRDIDVFSQPPVSQGAVLLRALRLLAGRTRDAIPAMPEYWVEAVRVLRVAFGERLALLGDFPDRAARAAAMIDGPDPGCDGDPVSPFARQGTETTTLAVMDKAGNAVSLILSVFADLGSGVVARDSGVLLNNRLSGFFLDPEHPNTLRPGRRSMTTLHSFLVQDADGVRFVGGSPGGDVQPQVNLQLITRMIDFGETPEAAIAAPRWAALPGTVPADLDKAPFARIDTSLDLETRAGLASLGCRIVEAADNNIGSQKIVGRSGDGLGAWCDRRRDAAVAAI